MDQKNNILEVNHLKTQFKVGRKTVYAVNDVSFSLKRRHTLGIVGESGCGKTVTANSILQLLPKAGNIVDGTISFAPDPDGPVLALEKMSRSGKEIRAVRGQQISMIFQNPQSSLNPVYTIGQQIMENLLLHEKISKEEGKTRIIALLKELGIPEPEQRYDEYPHQFSGGMRQRVMIAIAMICNPSLLIADEPTTALDVTIQAQILRLMKKLQKEHGTSTILITHNMGIVAEVCDEVAVMYMGRVVESGTLEQIFANPLHPYTRALLRSVPVLGMEEGTQLASIPGNTPDASIAFDHCEFEPRCGEKCSGSVCTECFPEILEIEPGHFVRCRRFEGLQGFETVQQRTEAVQHGLEVDRQGLERDQQWLYADQQGKEERHG